MLTMDDLGKFRKLSQAKTNSTGSAVHEYGINLKRQDFMR